MSGRTRSPIVVVPSANTTSAQPSAMRRATIALTSGSLRFCSRGTKTVSNARANGPMRGQLATSARDTKATGSTAPSTATSR